MTTRRCNCLVFKFMAFAGTQNTGLNAVCADCSHGLSLHLPYGAIVPTTTLAGKGPCKAMIETDSQSDIEKILDDREQTHGSFRKNAETYYAIIDAMEAGKAEVTSVQGLALAMIALKLARICSTPNEPDHWKDIEGYAKLARRELEK